MAHRPAKKNYRSYCRGEVVYVQFDPQFGHELKGPHYAIVLTRNDDSHSPIINVVPLSSKDGKGRNLKLGRCFGPAFYKQLNRDLNNSINRRSRWAIDHQRALMNKKKIQDIESDLKEEFGAEFVDTIEKSMARDFANLTTRWNKERRKANALSHRQSWFMNKNIDSYAVINQVQAIDKDRIIEQQGNSLAGLTVEDTIMRLIDAKICDTMIEYLPGETVEKPDRSRYNDGTNKSE